MDRGKRQLSPAQIDWRRPWFAPWAEPGRRVAARLDSGLALHEALNAEPGAPVRFVDPSALPAGAAYEQCIFESGNCPVRPGLHDFFNGLCWLRLPLSKARLNRLQAAEIEANGVGAVRGAVRDAITLLDENGVLLHAPEQLWSALLQRDWRRLFVDLRPLWADARVLVVGHALLEKLVRPRKELTAHVWNSRLSFDSMAHADESLADQLTAAMLATKPFTPLPLPGIPGWCAENLDVSFYDDARVFRPRRAPPPAAVPDPTSCVTP